MARVGIHHKLAHMNSARPWEVTEDVFPGLSCTITVIGPWIPPASAAKFKIFNIHPKSLRHDSEGEFSHQACGVGLVLVEPSTVASLMYSLIDRNTVRASWKTFES